jgi:hypothetical protein
MGVDVSEIYSPPRVVALAKRYGLREGFSLDLTTQDENGNPWDFEDPEQRAKAKALVLETKPWLLIGSPPCTFFSILQNWNHGKMDPEKYQRELRRAMTHLEFCIELYHIQIQHGRYFLHEHPNTATSWKTDCISRLLIDESVGCVVSDMCQYGMEQTDENGQVRPVKKPTRWMSNAPHILSALDRRCGRDDQDPEQKHQHVHLIGGRARAAQVYPIKLCQCILKGLRDQLRDDGVISEKFVGSVEPDEEHAGYSDPWGSSTTFLVALLRAGKSVKRA